MSDLSLTGRLWQLPNPAPERDAALARALGVPVAVATCLAARGADTEAAGRSALSPSLAQLHDPHQMLGLDAGVDRLRRAVRDRERIRFVTDYDVDGTTSSLILQATLRLLGHPDELFDYHIPNRMTEGYGFSLLAAEAAARDGVSLIVTADIGVKDHAAVSRAREGGVDVVVCDHHLTPGEGVPGDAVAVLCPPQEGCPYPNKALAACGVSFKLAQALLADHPRHEVLLRSLSKLAAIGTVADVVDLFTPENRAIVTLGLRELNSGRHAPGLAALLRVAKCEQDITARQLGFQIGPRINAAGRLDSARLAVDLIQCRDPQRARELAERIDRTNSERRAVQEALVVEALARAGDDPAPFVVVWGDEHEDPATGEVSGWHRGVVGIVAARVRDRTYRPAAVLAVRDGRATGSVRTTEEVHAVRALETVAHLLEKFGGHPVAAGFSCPEENLPAVAAGLAEAALAQVGGEMPVQRLRADAEITAAELGWELQRSLSCLEPHGKGNAKPRFVVRGAATSDHRTMGQDGRHLRLWLDEPRIGAVWWGGSEHLDAVRAAGGRVDLYGKLDVNTYQGKTRLQFVVDDARLP